MSNESKKELRNSIAKRLSGHLEVETPDERPYIETLGERLANAGVSRRSFMKYCMGVSAMMAIPASLMPKLVEAALLAPVTSVAYLSFQECTGCLESLVNVFPGSRIPNTTFTTNSIEGILLTALSLDYSETLMAPSGDQAEVSRAQAIKRVDPVTKKIIPHVLIVDGAIPDDKAGAGFFIQRGQTGLQLLKAAATNAAAVISVGTCASFGGLPAAKGLNGLSPTRAISINAALKSFGGTYATMPVINVSGCPPIAEVIAGTLIYWILNNPPGSTTKIIPSLDSNLRPKMYYGETVHDECYRKEFFEHGQFVESFDDAGARAGHCLIMMGCKGPTTHNACTTLKWNQATGYPMQAGHGCLGCSEPGFWDQKSIDAKGNVGVGFYNHLDPATVDD